MVPSHLDRFEKDGRWSSEQPQHKDEDKLTLLFKFSIHNNGGYPLHVLHLV